MSLANRGRRVEGNSSHVSRRTCALHLRTAPSHPLRRRQRPAPTGSRPIPFRSPRRRLSSTSVPNGSDQVDRPIPGTIRNKWGVIMYAIGSNARTARLCTILLVASLPPLIVGILIRHWLFSLAIRLDSSTCESGIHYALESPIEPATAFAPREEMELVGRTPTIRREQQASRAVPTPARERGLSS